MLAQKRHQEILHRLNSQGTVRTIEIAADLKVTDETIRRDLQTLSDGGFLERVHGGAMLKGERPRSLAFNERLNMNMDAKRVIAQAALPLIKDGDIVAFDSSTTVAELVSILPDVRLKVITNALNVINALVDRPGIELFCIGGSYEASTRRFSDSDFINALHKYNINKFFISANGFDLRHGASETFKDQAFFKGKLIESCEQVYLLVDHTKLGKRADYFFADINNITSIITDSQADKGFLDNVRIAGIDVRIGEMNT